MTMVTGLHPPVITGGDEGRAFWFLDTLVVDWTPRQGAVPTVMEMTIPAGASPPEHVHETEDDSFYLLDGRLAVRCGDQRFVASAGDYLALPRGVPHTFRVLDDQPATQIVAADLSRFPREIEAAIYFCCLEALQNVHKYAEAERVVVTLAASDGEVEFTVVDDGPGFDPGSGARRRSGQHGDRVSALGGRLDVASTLGGGTRVTGVLPVAAGSAPVLR